MNLDAALGGTTHDTWSVRLMKGLPKEQLKSRFGEVRAFKEARPYDQLCASPDAEGELEDHPSGKKVVFLQDSDWMVFLDNGKAVDLVLCK